jgi:23S rRNA (uridine2552-2'-O)-methyltransferase
MRDHVADPYVQRAQSAGYRSRAAFKLLEIDAKDKLIQPSQFVVDLGAAPGSWSQVLAERVGKGGRVVAIDLLEVAPIGAVEVIRGDFREEGVLKQLQTALAGRKVDLVVSDMAPNLSGVDATDQARSMHLCELALEFAQHHLKADGAFLVKCFQGAGFAEYLAAMRSAFRVVVSRKPKASRDRSSEMYLLGRGSDRRAGPLIP